MTWTMETSQGFEVRKIRDRISEYLHGFILDIGCGDEKVCAEAVGIDYLTKGASFSCDLSHPEALRVFNDNVADVVFSSHFLEHVHDYKGMLKHFMRICKPGGHVILYLPHRDLYPNIGQEGANPDHKHDFVPDDIIKAIPGTFTIKRNEVRDQDNEYSFELIIEKVSDHKFGELPYKPTVYDKDNTVVLVRYGGYGDMAVISPVYRMLKEQGKYVIANCNTESMVVLEGNPYIDEFLLQSRYVIPPTQLGEYFDSMREKYGTVINLCESMERTLLLEKDKDPELYWSSHEDRQKRCNVNYADYAMRLAGFDSGCKPELYLTETEAVLSKIFTKRHDGFFNLLWQVDGSSWHKIYPFTTDVIEELLDEIPDMQVFITGGPNASIDGWKHHRLMDRLRVWDMRQSMIMTKFMDCVVSPETGVLNAAGAFDTPKVGLLTHSSKENLTKYFINDYSIQSEAPCSPCHRLVHDLSDCPVDDEFGLPVCMSVYMPQERIKQNILTIYNKWKESRNEGR